MVTITHSGLAFSFNDGTLHFIKDQTWESWISTFTPTEIRGSDGIVYYAGDWKVTYENGTVVKEEEKIIEGHSYNKRISTE